MPDYLIDIADAARPALRRAVLTAFEAAANAKRPGQGGDEETLLSAWAEEAVPRIEAGVKDANATIFQKAGPKTFEQVRAGQAWRFDAINPRAVEYVQAHTGELIVAITRQQREAVRQAINRVVGAEISAGQAAKQIRGVIGLTPKMEQAVWNYRKNQIKAGLPLTKVDRVVERYRTNLIKGRAETIARTETIKALTEGRIEAWRQSVEAGLLPTSSEKKWIVTDDDRLCPTCAPMTGERATLEGLFSTGVDGPPLHPRCRCAITIVRGQPDAIRTVRTDRVSELR